MQNGEINEFLRTIQIISVKFSTCFNKEVGFECCHFSDVQFYRETKQMLTKVTRLLAICVLHKFKSKATSA